MIHQEKVKGDEEVKANFESCKRLTGCIVAALFFSVMSVQQGAAQQVLSDTKKKPASTAAGQQETAKNRTKAPEPQEKVESGASKYWLYGGAAALGIGLAAAAGGGGGGGSSAPACEEELVGPDLNGSDWRGILTLLEHGAEGIQEVTARITHCGRDILIQTTSTLSYGKTFDGKINASGDMLVIEHVRRQDWTTHFGPASSTHIDIYDYVNDFDDFDSLILNRTLAPAQ